MGHAFTEGGPCQPQNVVRRFLYPDRTIPAHIVQRQDSDPTHVNNIAKEPGEPNDDQGKDGFTPPPPMMAEQKQEAVAHRPGLYFAGAGYDGFVKIWSAYGWQLLTTLQTDGSKIMSVDLSTDSKLLVSGTHDRNSQLFACESKI
jgi:U4/U6 small nuclear ribonucleoprotein PRP4